MRLTPQIELRDEEPSQLTRWAAGAARQPGSSCEQRSCSWQPKDETTTTSRSCLAPVASVPRT